MAADNAVTYKGPEYVNEGETATIQCQMSRYIGPKWTHNDQPIEEGSKRFAYTSEESVGIQRIEKITIGNVQIRDHGYYRCNSFTRNAHFLNVIPVHSSYENITSGNSAIFFLEIKQENSRIEINCPLDIFNPDAPVTW